MNANLYKELRLLSDKYEQNNQIANHIRNTWESALELEYKQAVNKALEWAIEDAKYIIEKQFGSKMHPKRRDSLNSIMRKAFCYVLHKYLLLSNSTIALIVGIVRTTVLYHITDYHYSVLFDHLYSQKLKEIDRMISNYVEHYFAGLISEAAVQEMRNEMQGIDVDIFDKLISTAVPVNIGDAKFYAKADIDRALRAVANKSENPYIEDLDE